MKRDVRWLAEHSVEGTRVFRIGTAGDELVAEWSGLARLTARRDGSSSSFEEDPSADPCDVAKVRRGSAAMLLRHLEGKLALHGAAVAIDRRAVVLTAESGQGKSTLAACLVAGSGASLLSDDVVAIDPPSSTPFWMIHPLEEDHWLDAEARRCVQTTVESACDDEARKLPVRAPRLGRGSEALRVIIELAFQELPEPRLVQLRGLEALRVLVSQTVRLVIDEPLRHKTELDRLATLASQIPIFRLERPRCFELLQPSCVLVATLLQRGMVS